MSKYKPKKKKLTPTSERAKSGPKKKTSIKQYAIVGLMILGILAWFWSQLPIRNGNTPEPPFVKEGTLSFINGNTGKTLKGIDIEVADNPSERAQGMMFRKSMKDSEGMLFVMERNEQQGFWMKNTYIPLDIIFIGGDSTIVNIHKNAVPHNLTSLPSKGSAKYVVEVNGGWTSKMGIAAGDKIAFEIF